MANVKDAKIYETLLRQWAMLRLMPRFPRKITTSEIRQRLEDQGYLTTVRTVQRDLEKLSISFQLFADNNRPRGWCWARDAQVLDLPAMDMHTALTLKILENQAQYLLPPATMSYLGPHLDKAQNILNEFSGDPRVRWPAKVRVMHGGPLRLPPKVDQGIIDIVYSALLKNEKIMLTYKRMESGKNNVYKVNPLGLVFKNGVGYIVATLMDYMDVRQLALHRILDAEPLHEDVLVPEGFTLDGYIAEGGFGFREGGFINLRIFIDPWMVRLLEDTPLATDQKLEPMDDGRTMLAATVLNGEELFWWLLSYGEAVEVVEPKFLREKMVNAIRCMAELYDIF